MTAVDDIVSSLPMSQLAGQVGSDPSSTEAAVRQLLPTLLGGLHANAQDPAGAASLQGALDQHDGNLVEGGVDLNHVDPQDGSKIVHNIFGDNTDQVTQTLGGSLGGQTGLVQKLLPILAPIVLAYISRRFAGGQSSTGQQGGGLADVLGGMLGGGAGSGSSGGLGDLLGGMLGGGAGSSSGSSSGGGLGDILGGLLGGGRR